MEQADSYAPQQSRLVVSTGCLTSIPAPWWQKFKQPADGTGSSAFTPRRLVSQDRVTKGPVGWLLSE